MIVINNTLLFEQLEHDNRGTSTLIITDESIVIYANEEWLLLKVSTCKVS